jgi:bifunctional UDP-N-acetylglucosamine pyrophosphorylase/glucosamine-1-phosphate N-acetyltransferase
MRSDVPKVLHTLAGKTLLEHVYAAASGLGHRGMHIVYGYGGDRVPGALAHLQARWVEQPEQLGTGHAVRQVMEDIPDSDTVLILYGDVPLISPETLQKLVTAAADTGFSLLTSYIDDPSGYGRILRDAKGDISSVVEEKDAAGEHLAVCEVNTGMMAINSGQLKHWLAALGNDNAQGEYYLTDVIAMAVADGVAIQTLQPESAAEIRGVNDRAQLAEMERHYQLTQAHQLMRDGVTLMDPARFDLRGGLEAGRDVSIDVNVVIEGRVSLGSNVRIGPNCYIKNADIGDGVILLPNCVIEDAVIGRNCHIGPFARIRPQTRLADEVHVGNFVELKNAEVGDRSKINHLSYVGDTEIGRDTNIGAGTITCNYDGANKHRTVIGDNVHVGSDTQLVAPVRIGDGVTIGAGTTVTRDVAAGTLVHNKLEWRKIKGWKRPRKN